MLDYSIYLLDKRKTVTAPVECPKCGVVFMGKLLEDKQWKLLECPFCYFEFTCRNEEYEEPE